VASLRDRRSDAFGRLSTAGAVFCTVWLPLTCLFRTAVFAAPERARSCSGDVLVRVTVSHRRADDPEFQTGLLLGAYALYRGWYLHGEASRLRGQRALGRVDVARAFLVAAVQLIPAGRSRSRVARARPFPFDLVRQWSMPWAKLLELVLSTRSRTHLLICTSR